MNQNEIIEKALVLKNSLNAHKVILESLDYQLNEVLINVSNHNLPIKDEQNNVKNPHHQRYRGPNREPL